MTLELVGISAPPLVGVTARFEPGVNVVLGGSEDGTAALVALAGGASTPRAGRVLVAGGDPRRTPALRRRIVCVLETEELLPGKHAVDSLRAALELRGAGMDAQNALATIGLARWSRRSPRELGARERRSLALALALAVDDPVLLALHEPFADVPGTERRAVRERIVALAGAGATVICATASVRDALELGGRIWVLHRGRIVREVGASTAAALVPSGSVELVVRTNRPRELAAALGTERAVSAVFWNDRDAPGQLAVRGAEIEATASAIVRTARSVQARLIALAPALPGVQQVKAASAGLARAAYEEAYRVAGERARVSAVATISTFPPPPPVPGSGERSR